MNKRTFIKTAVDFAMTVLLLLLMTYELIGAAAHEWMGIAMFALVIAHHVLNRKWSRSLFKGRYTAVRILQTTLVALILLSMLGSMVSGIVISRHALAFLLISGAGWARTVHLLCGYWGFVLMSLHLGLHWGMMLGMVGKRRKPSLQRALALKVIGLGVAIYGVVVFVKRGLPGYMLLQNQFVFFDFSEPLAFFLLDYLAIMGLFVWAGHYFSKFIRKIK